MAESRKGDHAEMTETLITEEALEKYRSRIGMKLRTHTTIDEVSRLSLKLVTNGVGDSNPLWTDPEYAKKTRYGRNPAPPYFMYRVNPGWVQHGLPGVHAFHSGSDWTLYKPALIGDTVTPDVTFTGYDEKKSEFAGKMIMEYQEGKYFNQKGELLAVAKGWLVRVERASSREKGKYSQIQLPHPWTEEELAKVDEETASVYPCSFSIFQSLPDPWAIDHPGAIARTSAASRPPRWPCHSSARNAESRRSAYRWRR